LLAYYLYTRRVAGSSVGSAVLDPAPSAPFENGVLSTVAEQAVTVDDLNSDIKKLFRF
jgi:hypothetical protein